MLPHMTKANDHVQGFADDQSAPSRQSCTQRQQAPAGCIAASRCDLWHFLLPSKCISLTLRHVYVAWCQAMRHDAQGSLEKALDVQLKGALARPLQDSLRSSFQNQLLPAFEAACQTMFSQVCSSTCNAP